jgi:putative DNA primase/helicase
MKNGVAIEAETNRSSGLTVAEYATAKKLPLEFLESIGVRQVYLGGKAVVGIPYKDSNGKEVAARFRLALGKEQDRFRWHTGSKPILYGLWRLRKSGVRPYIFLPEGESDTQTLWLHKFPALGLPGANSWKEEWAAHLDNFERIYVPIEPDQGGEAVLRWLSKSKIRNRARLVKL